MPEPDPARLAALRRIAEVSAGRIWARVGGERARYHHGLDLEDLVSAAWEAILRALPRHDGREHDAYLWRSAKGGVIDALRRADPLDRGDRARRSEAGEATAVTDSLDALAPWLLFDRSEVEADQRAAIEARDAARIVHAALDLLGDLDRALLLVLYHGDLTQREVAEAVGVSHATISQRHALALRRLERALVVRHGREVFREG